MKKFIILSDVSGDISPEIQAFCGVEDYARGYVHMSDGRDFETEMNWNKISREEYYKILSNKKIEVSSAPWSPEQFYLKFKKYAEKGYDILSMSISSGISSTYNVACGAAERVRKEYPECEIYTFDSFRMANAYGLLVMYAHLMKKEGKSMTEIIDWLEENKYKVHQMGPIDDLMFVARRGRISMGKAIMGSFAGVKPMGDCSQDGYVSVITKVKGMKKALEVTTSYVAETIVNPEEQYVIIGHSNREEYANVLRDLLSKAINVKKIFISDVFAGSGANVGPGMVGVYYLGNTISDGLEEEKAIVNKVLESSK